MECLNESVSRTLRCKRWTTVTSAKLSGIFELLVSAANLMAASFVRKHSNPPKRRLITGFQVFTGHNWLASMANSGEGHVCETSWNNGTIQTHQEMLQVLSLGLEDGPGVSCSKGVSCDIPSLCVWCVTGYMNARSLSGNRMMMVFPWDETSVACWPLTIHEALSWFSLITISMPW